MKKLWWMAAMGAALSIGLVPVQTQSQAPPMRVYAIATAHLDTQWNWTVQDTIRDFIPKTFHTNFDFFEKYPNYNFSWEGVIHYMWFKEYHPDEWSKVQKYVADGRWRLAGSWIDAVDPNMPSPESLFRQALYGQRFYRQEFNKVSRDVYLPDSFGFGYALPTIAVHSGLNAFSTQKLTWGRAIPFPIGRWRGVDGSEVIAALNPGAYVTQIREEISLTSTNGGRAGGPPWLNDPTLLDGRRVEFRLYGTGDTGGGPTDQSVQFIQKAIADKNPNLEVLSVAPDQLAKDLSPEAKALLPVYNDELILKTHGTGCYTSQSAMKTFNRANEILAEAAEKASVAARWLGGLVYPSERLRESWIRFLWHQFHDDLTGTSLPQAYQFSWNDELASLNQFAGVLTSATSTISGLMDTSGPGVPLVVYNPVSMDRTEAIEATVRLSAPATFVNVVDALTGIEVPAQVIGNVEGGTRIAFVGTVPSLGYRVFNVVPSAPPVGPVANALRVSASMMENNRIAVKIDANGDIASIYDKDAKHELLRAPIMLEMRDNPSGSWPAWEVLYDTVQSPAREYVSNPVIKVLERGPARVSLEITRKAAGSTFTQRIKLAQGSDRIDVENLIDWQSPNSLLKASFPFTASNPKAVYDLGIGTIERGNNIPDQYEVPAQRWAGIDDTGGTYGVAVINDSRHGWDKPNDHTLRLTLLHTPRPNTGYTYQSSNDLGHHRVVYSIAGHAGDWRQGRIPVKAAQVNQPLLAFQTSAHAGALGRSYSTAWIAAPSGGALIGDTSGQVGIVAMKQAEDSDEVIVRFQERYGRPANGVAVRFGLPIASAREVNAAEESVGAFALPGAGGGNRGGGAPAGAAPAVQPLPTGVANFTIDLKPYQPRTIALKLLSPWEAAANAQANATANAAAGAAAGRGAGAGGAGAGGGRGGGAGAFPNLTKPTGTASATLALPFNLDGVSLDNGRGDGNFDGKSHTIAGDLFPASLELNGIKFALGSSKPGDKNVLVPSGQQLAIPAGTFNRAYIIAAAVGSDVSTTVSIGATTKTLNVREWEGPVGQWWSRLRENAPALKEPFVPGNNRSNPSQQEIQAGLVVEWDPRTGIVKGIDQIRPAFVKRDEIAWVGTHRHDPKSNEIYVPSYLFLYAIDIPAGAKTITLPTNDRVRIMAVSVAQESPSATPAGALYMAEYADRLIVPPARK